jgi:formate/nitrite transporter FocA (FNT family)
MYDGELDSINYFCTMLTNQEKDFIDFWAKNRIAQKTSIRPFLIGLAAGLLFGLVVVAVLYSGWYTRANMQANSKLNGFVFFAGILLVSFFMAYLYRSFSWENREQQYKELLAKQKRQSKTPSIAP